jgi:hypothetical protein
MKLEQLIYCIDNNVPLEWNDPDSIKGNDYTITYIENINIEDFDNHTPILIHYNNGVSKAEVFLHEIIKKI